VPYSGGGDTDFRGLGGWGISVRIVVFIERCRDAVTGGGDVDFSVGGSDAFVSVDRG
jgi:hypothetical protein